MTHQKLHESITFCWFMALGLQHFMVKPCVQQRRNMVKLPIGEMVINTVRRFFILIKRIPNMGWMTINPRNLSHGTCESPVFDGEIHETS